VRTVPNENLEAPEWYLLAAQSLAICKVLHVTPSVPNYLSVLIGTQMLRNPGGICKNAQLGLNLDLNYLSYKKI
jgi:hypothetical protein